MTAPNIVNVTTITGKTAVQSVGTSATAIVSNAAASNAVYKINTLVVSNNDSAGHTITVDVFRSSVAYPISSTVNISASAAYDVLAKAIYLEEGDSIRLTGDAANKLTAVCSYEVIS